MAAIPARDLSVSRLSRTAKQRPKRCTGWFKLWADEHGDNGTRHSPGEPAARRDPRGADPAPTRTRRPWFAGIGRRRGRIARDLVGTGPELQPRYFASDSQYCRLYRCYQRRSPDADSWVRRDHADPADRGMGLAHADPPRLRSRSPAAWLLDHVHGSRRGICQLLASWRRVAAADRTRRRRR